MSIENSYGRVWLMLNPAGGMAKNFNTFRETLGGIPHKVLETSCNPLDTLETLAENVDHDDVVALHAGDGALRQVGVAAANLGLKAQIVPFDGGTTNCAAEAFNAKKERTLQNILENGRAMAVPLMQTSWGREGSKTVIEWISDNSYHAPVSALEAMAPNKARNNQLPPLLKWMDQIRTTIGTIASHEALTAQFGDDAPFKLASIIFAHSTVFAGEGRLHVSPFGRSYEMLLAPREGRAATTRRMLQLARGKLWGDIREEPISFTLNRDNRGPIHMEVDGDFRDHNELPLMIGSGTEVTVGVSDTKQFWTRTTRAA